MDRLTLGILILVFALAFTSCKKERGRRLPNMQLTLLENDSRPMGGKIAHDFLEQIYGEENFKKILEPFDVWLQTENKYDVPEGELYILISPRVMYWKKEAEAMKAYARAGNTILMVTDVITQEMADELGVNLEEPFGSPPFNSPADTWISVADSIPGSSGKYSFYYYELNKLINTDSVLATHRTVATNANGKSTAIRLIYGKGQILLATNAATFSNYFLLTNRNSDYLWNIASYLPSNPSEVYFDRFAQQNLYRQPDGSSLFSVLLRIPALKWAFGLLLFAGLLYVISNLRRKQRKIPVLPVNQNSTVAFVKTIANLYFNKRDNANISRKISQYYMERMRNRYYLPANIHPADLPEIIHLKTGMDLDELREMNYLMQLAGRYEPLTDSQLIRLHELVRKNLDTGKTQLQPVVLEN